MVTESDREIDKGLGIGDVSKMCKVPAYTIRFWEKEFRDYLAPLRTEGKQRRYSEEHLRQILHIKKLLWEDRFSIQGAKRLLRGNGIGPMVLDDSSSPITDTHDLALHLARFIGNYLTNSKMTASG
jgi:DNA-binding transcriptional MerR regulator